jgi:hypothetical protein|tara:strand:- start:66475 stop:66696 length:222 start_codon:yes stop_codon:yes gene_type:complete
MTTQIKERINLINEQIIELGQAKVASDRGISQVKKEQLVKDIEMLHNLKQTLVKLSKKMVLSTSELEFVKEIL